MSRFLAPAALLLSTVALFLTVQAGREKPSHPAANAPATPASRPEELARLEQRVRLLEQSVEALEARRPPALTEPSEEPAAPSSELAKLRAEVSGLLAGEALHSEGGREYLKDMVRTVQQELSAEQRLQRQRQWEAREQAARAEQQERWRRFAVEARLTYAQEQELLRLLSEEQARRDALMERLREGGPEARGAFRQLRLQREQTDQLMHGLFDEQQKARYDALREEEQRSRGPGRRDGGP